MAEDLYVKRAGEGPAVILLHGLFGAGSNLAALARALQAQFTVYSVDLPSHGRSAWLRNPDLPAMADRLRRWMDAEGVSQAHFVGHSLGGKVAMQLALAHAPQVASLVIADIAPVDYAMRHAAVFAALEAVVTGQCASREEAARLLAAHLLEDAVIQFLLTSLRRDTAGVWSWRFDLQGIRAAYPSLLVAPQADQAYPGPVLFVKGGASDYIQEQHWPAVATFFPAASIRVMPGCGHWLHAEKPQLFNGIVERFLVSPARHKPLVTQHGMEA